MLIAFAAVFVLFLWGVPIFAAFGLSSALALWLVFDMPPHMVAQVLYARADSYVLLAMPMFILAGNLLVHGGGVRYAVKLFDSWLGHVPGGLMVVVITGCAFFAAISGSGLAAILTLGVMLFPEMEKHGYERHIASAVIVIAAILGPIIPPSTVMIILGSLMEVSTGALFACGMIPGITIAGGLILVGILLAKWKKYPLRPAASWKERWMSLFKSIPFLTLPLAILGGIYSGYFTPTEAATVAATLALIIGIVYRGMSFPKIWTSLKGAAASAANIMVLMCGIEVFSKFLHLTGVPAMLTQAIMAAEMSGFVFVVISAAIVFALGFLFPPWATMFMLMPLLMPILLALGVNYYWFATIYCINVTAAGCTPPFAYSIFVGSRVLGVSFEDIVKGELWFLPVHYIVMIVIILFPPIALWLPTQMGMNVGL
jgi:C4-dicarboxylate transporter DctM subunit